MINVLSILINLFAAQNVIFYLYQNYGTSTNIKYSIHYAMIYLILVLSVINLL